MVKIKLFPINKKLASNIFSLSLLQIVNYVFPFLTIPYLSRVLSVEHYGLILFSFSFNTYFGILCDYGFGLTATRDVAMNSNNKEKINHIVSTVTFIKVIFFVFSLLCNLVIVFSIAKFRDYWFIYLLNCFTLIGGVFVPSWLFQGMQRMRDILPAQIITKVLSVVLIFLCIKSDSLYYLWPVINIVTTIVGAIYIQAILFKRYDLKYTIPTYTEIIAQLKEGWHVFLSTIAISLYTVSNSFFLGVLTSTAMVAYYASAEKILNAVQSLLSPITQALFPHLTKQINDDKEEGIKLLRDALIKVAILGAILSISLFIGSSFIVKLLFGHKYVDATTIVLKILSILPFIICLSNMFGIQTMIPFGLTKQFSRILMVSSVCNLIFTFILVPRFSYIGTAISVVLSEILVTGMMYFYLIKSGIDIIRGRILYYNQV